MRKTVLGSKSVRGKKYRRNIRKFAARYPQTQVQMIRRRNLVGCDFSSETAAPDFAALGAEATGF